MSVSRDITVRLLTNFNKFSEIIMALINGGFSFSENGIMSLSENDTDDFNFIEFDSFEHVKSILDSRESKGYSNHIVIWDKEIDDSLLVMSTKLENEYNRYKNQYEINFGIGIGVRIKGAERFTDFGIYLNKLIPALVKNSIYICEINCSDIDSY